jgi:phospholipid-translocating P-type ATPase (flippase)
MTRHKADAEANNRGAHIVNASTSSVDDGRWVDVTVGSIIKIYNKEALPADVLLLYCAKSANNPEGICNVETKELDGETNLKPRLPLSCTASQVRPESAMADLGQIKGQVKCELPNQFINKFSGTIELVGLPNNSDVSAAKPIVEPIEMNSVILRGSTLNSVEYVYALVLNTGVDTKIMQNMRKPELKLSTIEKTINNLIRCIVFILVIMCTFGAVGSSTWNHDNMKTAWYFRAAPHEATDGAGFFVDTDSGWETTETIVTFFYFFLIASQFVSISLYVSITSVKFFQSYFMQKNLAMYHDKTDTPMLVRTMSLNDELGVISHVFSDKTGTLTENVMEFRKCSIGGNVYGKGTTEIGIARSKRLGLPIEEDSGGVMAPYVNFNGPELFTTLEAEAKTGSGPCTEFFLHLSLCHSIIIDDNNEWSAQSPDELALISAADFFGFTFRGAQKGIITIKLKDGTEAKYEKLDEFVFTSQRKRMSMIVRDMKTGKIMVLSKGADNVMWRRCAEGAEGAEALKEQTSQQLIVFADDGLRTLVIASKEVDEKEYKTWKEKYKRATVDLSEMEKKKEGKPNKIDDLEDVMERNFTLLGSTAIEDKLQAGVPQCIADLALAGIATWVLTGDKEETAINIAHACLLLDTQMCKVVINLKAFGTLAAMRNELVGRARQIEQYKLNNPQGTQKFALVIDGDALQLAMETDEKGEYVGCQAALLRYAQHCVAVVACRCAPSQKAEIVQLVRKNIDSCHTLAIGDGANDVPMIQEAHVGVGISGHEGLQAVNSSDFAIAQFRFLKELLLVQGRNNYRRMSTLVLYLFYKNVMMVLTQYWFTISSTGVSGQKLNPEFGTQCFNVIWTFFPILILGVFDKDVNDDSSRAFPQMYNLGIQNYYFGVREYAQWLTDAIVESLCVTFVCLEALKHNGPNGMDVGLWMTGAHTFTMVILIVSFKILLLQNRWTKEMLGLWVLGIAFWWPCCYIGSIDNTHKSPKWATFAIGWRGLWFVVQELPVFWFLCILLPFMLLAPQALRAMWYVQLSSPRPALIPNTARLPTLFPPCVPHLCRARETRPEITDLAVEVEQFGLKEQEEDIKAWRVVAPAPEPVHLPGWDTCDEAAVNAMSALPISATTQASLPTDAPPSMVLSPATKSLR